jgi:hypothetical protein
MQQNLLGLVIVTSNEGLIAGTALVAMLTIYELASGNLLGSRWNVWATRKDRPKLYWSMVGMKAAFVLFVTYTFLLLDRR